MNKRVKTTKKPIPVPQSDAECRSAIREIGDIQRDALRLKAELDDRVAKLQEAFGEDLAPLTARIEALQEGVRVFCEANRDRLTLGGKVKFHHFTTGQVSWRNRPPKVTIRGKEAVIDALKRLGLRKFVRVKEDVDKDAMLASPDSRAKAAAVDGITIGSDGEDFTIEPFETEGASS